MVVFFCCNSFSSSFYFVWTDDLHGVQAGKGLVDDKGKNGGAELTTTTTTTTGEWKSVEEEEEEEAAGGWAAGGGRVNLCC